MQIFIDMVAALTLTACGDMDYHEYNIYDKDYITKNFSNVGGFMTDIYNTVEYDFGNYSGVKMSFVNTTFNGTVTNLKANV